MQVVQVPVGEKVAVPGNNAHARYHELVSVTTIFPSPSLRLCSQSPTGMKISYKLQWTHVAYHDVRTKRYTSLTLLTIISLTECHDS
jgi:hypothetical protein